jgi:hypothetical protein
MGNSSDSTVARDVGLRGHFSSLHATDSPTVIPWPASRRACASFALGPAPRTSNAMLVRAVAPLWRGVATAGNRCLR